MSSTERVRRWQKRQLAKSAMFVEMDNLRRRSLEQQFKRTRCTEGGEFLLEPVRDFFMAYFRCFTAPIFIHYDSETGRCACEFEHEINAWEHTAGVVAMLGIFDDLFPYEYHSCGAEIEVDQRWIDETREEVEHLRSLGLWTVKKRTTPATTIVKWVP
jgi:hypothetical protein